MYRAGDSTQHLGRRRRAYGRFASADTKKKRKQKGFRGGRLELPTHGSLHWQNSQALQSTALPTELPPGMLPVQRRCSGSTKVARQSKIKKCRHWESHPGYRRHKPRYCSYTIAAKTGWRYRASIPDLNLAKVVCYHLQHTPKGVRPSGLEPESYAWKA